MKTGNYITLLGLLVTLANAQTRIDWPNIKNDPVKSVRIIGGSLAEAYSRPFQVALIFNGAWLCSGTLISTTYVVTVAHCAYGAKKVEILAGSYSIYQTNTTTQQIFYSTDITIHENYSSGTSIANDIALIKLPDTPELQITKYVDVIEYASDESETYEGSTGLLTGWGLTESDNSLSQYLLQVDLDIISNSDCINSYSYIQDYMLCTDGSASKGGVTGDSGSPLTVDGKLVGIMSVGTTSSSKKPTVFTRIASFTSWFESFIGTTSTSTVSSTTDGSGAGEDYIY